MKAVQFGILAALLLCAGLMYKVYRGQQVAPATPAVETKAPAAPATPATEPGAPAATPGTPAQAVAPAAAPAEPAVAKKPSPVRGWRKQKAGQKETVAENRPPAVSAPAPAPTPAQAPAPAPTAPEPAPAPAQPLSPPSGTPAVAAAPRVPHTVTIPAGTMISVRLTEALSSDKNQPGDTFSATLDQPLVVDSFAIAERGARVQGKVVEAEKAGRVKGLASLAVHLTRLNTADGQEVAILTQTFRKEGPKSTGDDVKKIGVGAALGAAIGAIAGGGKGAAIGAGVGGAAGTGTVMATRGKPAELPVETRMTFRLQEPVALTERIK